MSAASMSPFSVLASSPSSLVEGSDSLVWEVGVSVDPTSGGWLSETVWTGVARSLALAWASSVGEDELYPPLFGESALIASAS